MTEENDIQKLRAAMKTALQTVTVKDLVNLCEANSGVPFVTGHSNVSKFMHGGTTLNGEDLQNIRTLLFTTDTGALLLKKKNTTPPPITALIEALRSGRARSGSAELFRGAFLAYHGSYMHPDHFVVRVLNFQHLGDGLIEVTDHLQDDKSATPGDIKATGAVSFPGDKPHILLLRRDNAIGFNLIVGHDLAVSNESTVLIGQMTGVNRKNEHFSRPILMRKTPKPLTELLSMTGIRPFDDLDVLAKIEFRHLVRELPKPVFDDPLLKHVR